MQSAIISAFSLTAQIYLLYVLIMKLPNFSNYITNFLLYKVILQVANNFVLLLNAKFEILQCNSPNSFIL